MLVALLFTHRSMFSGASTPLASAQSRKKRHIAAVRAWRASPVVAPTLGPNGPERAPRASTLDRAPWRSCTRGASRPQGAETRARTSRARSANGAPLRMRTRPATRTAAATNLRGKRTSGRARYSGGYRQYAIGAKTRRRAALRLRLTSRNLLASSPRLKTARNAGPHRRDQPEHEQVEAQLITTGQDASNSRASSAVESLVDARPALGPGAGELRGGGKRRARLIGGGEAEVDAPAW